MFHKEAGFNNKAACCDSVLQAQWCHTLELQIEYILETLTRSLTCIFLCVCWCLNKAENLLWFFWLSKHAFIKGYTTHPEVCFMPLSRGMLRLFLIPLTTITGGSRVVQEEWEDRLMSGHWTLLIHTFLPAQCFSLQRWEHQATWFSVIGVFLIAHLWTDLSDLLLPPGWDLN